MKICLISPTYPPRRGGLETHIASLAHGLADAGHLVCVFTNRDQHEQAEYSIEGNVEVVRASGLLGEWNTQDKVAWEEAMFGLLKDVEHFFLQHKFDVVHAHTQAGLLLASMAKSVYKAPLVASFHETEPAREACGLSRSRFISKSAPVTAVIVGSRYFLNQALSHGIQESVLRLVYYGIEPSTFNINEKVARREMLVRLGIPEETPVIALIGRFKARKGQKNFLDAFVDIQRSTGSQAVLIGSCSSASSEYLHDIKDFVREHALETTVHILEDCSPQLRDIVVAGCSILTQPSHSEGLGLAILEGMSAGKVVVGANIPGIDEVIHHEETGFLIDTKNRKAYAAILDRLIKNPQLCKTIGERARAHVHYSFSVIKMVNETLNVYVEAISMVNNKGEETK